MRVKRTVSRWFDALDELIDKQLFGAVVAGKFIGDELALVLSAAPSQHITNLLGIGLGVAGVAYWRRVEAWLDQAKDAAEEAVDKATE